MSKHLAMKNLKALLVLLFSALTFSSVAQNYGNSLPATDALGRKLPSAKEVGFLPLVLILVTKNVWI